MLHFESGVLERTKIFSNILLILLLVGNIFFSIHYIESLKVPEPVDTTEEQVTRTKTAIFLKLFVEKVLQSNGTVSFEDRVQLENDVRQLHKVEITRKWEGFVASKNSKEAQVAATDLLILLANELR